MSLAAWMRQLIGRSGYSTYPDPTDRLIDVPAERDPSPDLLRRLRAIDRRAEVLYIGQGRWQLLRIKPGTPRVRAGQRLMLSLMTPDGFPSAPWDLFRQARLMMAGAGLVDTLTIQGEPDARLEQALRRFVYVEQGGVVDDEERAAEAARRDRARRFNDETREKTKHLFRRSAYGRGNPFVGYGTRGAGSTGRVF